MFGLEGHKKKKQSEEFIFDLERDLKTAKEKAVIKKKVEERIQQVKNTLRSGEDKQEFDQFGVLLHGYASLLRVISRVGPK